MLRLFVAVLLSCPTAAFAQAARTVNVTGSAVVERKPDVATVRYSFIDELRLTPTGAVLQQSLPAEAKPQTAATLPAMVQKNRARVTPAVDYVKGVVGKEGSVEVLPSVQRQYEWNEKTRKNELVGYRIVTNIQVKLEGEAAIEQKLGDLFDTSRVKADEMSEPAMSLTEPTRKAAQREAYQLAVEDAVQTATAQLEPGETLGVALQRGDRVEVPYPRYEMAARAMSADAPSGGRAPVETGKITVQSMIEFVFEVGGKPARLGAQAGRSLSAPGHQDSPK